MRPERYTSPHIDLGAAYTDVKFVVKRTLANRTCDRTSRTGLLLSLGRFQVYEAIQKEEEEKPVPSNPKENINLVFIGNSITYGATLSHPATQAPPIICRQMVEDATGVTTHVFNGGHSGITTWGYLPGRSDFTTVSMAANTFVRNNGGLLYFSIMLGTNDSAIIGTEGAPVSTETYRTNMKAIIDELIRRFPTCKIIVNYPLWYSPNTHNGSRYLEEGMTRLRSYYPIIDALVTEYDQVYAGERGVWEYFENNRPLFTAERGNSGTFYLHPNAEGAVRLAEIWTRSLLTLIKADGVKVKK
ncbi:MAG: lipolytic protein G-D-S-L family [Bacteroidaceae bacterium]|nr:lipolytic protein G-D-S-L family [Bacteroidaceae bacterium]